MLDNMSTKLIADTIMTTFERTDFPKMRNKRSIILSVAVVSCFPATRNPNFVLFVVMNTNTK